MDISNAAKAEISYRHKDEIAPLFKSYVKGNLEIDHFSLNIFFGNGQSIFLSPTPQMAEELCKHNFVNEDSTYNPDVYQKLSLYPWRSVQRHATDGVINFIKEEKFGMRSGIMIVRNLGQGRCVMYSIATHKKDHPEFPGQFYFLFHCKGNYLAQLGDFMYDSLLPVINEYGHQTGVYMPKIEDFKPISLEASLQTDEQREMLEAIQTGKKVNLIKLAQKMQRNSQFCKLIKGGKVANDFALDNF